MFIWDHSQTTESFLLCFETSCWAIYLKTRPFEVKSGEEDSGNYSEKLKQVSVFHSVTGIMVRNKIK
jgi:hypothetical protein